MITVPDAPQYFISNVGVLTTTQIGLTWYNGQNNGGSQVIDYTLWYAVGTNGTFTILAQNVPTMHYILSGLITGQQYKFMVQSRNIVGLGAFSQEIIVKPCSRPSTPAAPVTLFTQN